MKDEEAMINDNERYVRWKDGGDGEVTGMTENEVEPNSRTGI